MLLCGIGIIFIAMGTANILNAFYPLSHVYIRLCEYIGYLSWSLTLGMKGWDIQTWDGNTLPEQLNQILAKVFALIGIFAFVLARELISAV